ncbi:MAG: enoyl-CoA hydratase/isomerase family protein [Deltaproteobacteria bacterium]|nr:enoyl-CoA hydratase/isomerase family protein [Deltaproteobacteria bacterium]
MSILLYEKKDHIAYITLNNPPLNTMSRELARELIKALHDFDADDDLYVGIVTGSGDRSFCAGADLTDKEHLVDPEGWEADYDWQLANIKKPLICAVNGYCLGAGFGLALCCDIRIASEKASLGTPDQKLNTVDAYASIMLSRMIPASIAMEILMTGDRVSAQEAYRIGLVSRLVPPAELMPTAEALAKKICNNGPAALWACKEINRRARYLSLEDGLSLFKALAGPVLKMEDTREGVAAFFEKRPPQWKLK